jgi:NADPH-dependent curcumin reductase CurA
MLNRRFVLVRRPVGHAAAEDFKIVAEPAPKDEPGSIVVRNHYVSLDPTQLLWMRETETYMPAIALGAPVRASTVGVVHSSAAPGFAEGDWVMGLNAIEDYSLMRPDGFTMKIDVSKVPSPTNYLSVMGAVGLSAYFGLLLDGKPQPGETLLVSGAAGAVGSAVGQIGKIMGCRVIGIAGGPEKCRLLVERYGFDTGIDYRAKSVDQLAAEIQDALPDGANIVFENVGGVVFDAELKNLAEHARIVLCGMISEYGRQKPAGVRNIQEVLLRCASIKAFRIAEHVAEFPSAGRQMAQWIKEGRLRADEEVHEGLENAYSAFMRLFSGANTGKLILKIA